MLRSQSLQWLEIRHKNKHQKSIQGTSRNLKDPQGTSRNLRVHQRTSGKQIYPISVNDDHFVQADFSEAPLVRQANVELKNPIVWDM